MLRQKGGVVSEIGLEQFQGGDDPLPGGTAPGGAVEPDFKALLLQFLDPGQIPTVLTRGPDDTLIVVPHLAVKDPDGFGHLDTELIQKVINERPVAQGGAIGIVHYGKGKFLVVRPWRHALSPVHHRMGPSLSPRMLHHGPDELRGAIGGMDVLRSQLGPQIVALTGEAQKRILHSEFLRQPCDFGASRSTARQIEADPQALADIDRHVVTPPVLP